MRMTSLCYTLGHESPPHWPDRRDPRESPLPGRGGARCLAGPANRDDDLVLGGVSPQLLGRTFWGESDDPDALGASVEAARPARPAGETSAGPSHPTDGSLAPSVIGPPEAQPGAVRSAPCGL